MGSVGLHSNASVNVARFVALETEWFDLVGLPYVLACAGSRYLERVGARDNPSKNHSTKIKRSRTRLQLV